MQRSVRRLADGTSKGVKKGSNRACLVLCLERLPIVFFTRLPVPGRVPPERGLCGQYLPELSIVKRNSPYNEGLWISSGDAEIKISGRGLHYMADCAVSGARLCDSAFTRARYTDGRKAVERCSQARITYPMRTGIARSFVGIGSKSHSSAEPLS